jgi:hypothetical protein
MDTIERRQERPSVLAQTAKKDVEEILKQLDKDGKIEERKALIKHIKETDQELAELQVNLMDQTVFVAGLAVGIVIMVVTKKVLENYFK